MNDESQTLGDARDRQKAATRDQILRVVGGRVVRGPLDELSFADIAKDAGVGERTVYRHFPTREALLGAYFAWAQTQATLPLAPPAAEATPQPKPTPAPTVAKSPAQQMWEPAAPVEDIQRPMRILLATDAWEIGRAHV